MNWRARASDFDGTLAEDGGIQVDNVTALRTLKKAGVYTIPLKRLNIPSAATAGLGDGKNDLVLLQGCGMRVAVANAVPIIKAIATYVLESGPEKSLDEAIGILFPELIFSTGVMNPPLLDLDIIVRLQGGTCSSPWPVMQRKGIIR
ncbi:MAG: Cof-type family hydrolase [Verrucomicrobiaceae bacterium]|nr:Cof-type family hydrolase [Verrucomicrobiaceae bacterium]